MFPGGWEWLVVLAIVVLIFGAGKLPNVMGDVAKGIKKFKAGMAESPSDDKKPIDAKEPADSGVSAKSERTEAEKKQNAGGHGHGSGPQQHLGAYFKA